MNLIAIAVFIAGAIIYKFLPARWRGWALLVGSVVGLYWLFWIQPQQSIRPLDFILPSATLLLGVLGWFIVRQEPEIARDNWITAGIVAGVILLIAVIGAISSYFSLNILPTRPPNIVDVVVALAAIGIVLLTFAILIQDRQRAIPLYILAIIAIFVILKAPPLTLTFSEWVRGQTRSPISLATIVDIQWLGFSYISFRMIHTLRDRQTGKLPALSMREYLTYLIFFPAYTAGPIDRAERFVKDYRALPDLTAARATEGLTRVAVGIFKKFIIADSLALFAMSALNVTQVQSAGAMWVLLYAYSLRIFFDFSGYSDIAIGIGRLYGINLPENFDRPYLKDNITTFWQSWHMTLSTWARNYVFTPLSRTLMGNRVKLAPNMIVLIAQVATMVTIGLWHGITLNFVLWGLWHGIGLWIHKLYTDRTRAYYQGLEPQQRRIANWIGVLITFHFVALGWLWFALPTPALTLTAFRRLFGG